MTGADAETLGVYARDAARYAEIVADTDKDPVLKALLNTLPEQSRVLDLGCGPGHLAARLRDLGHEVTATDASPEMAAQAKVLFDLDVTVATFDDLDEVDTYDGVLASFSLLHAPKDRMPEHLATIRRALRPDGVLSIGLKMGEGAHRDTLGRFYAYYTDEEITGLLEAAGFTVISRSFGEGKGLDGKLAKSIVLGARA
ncbi:class I SAM-dependent methyltransferase [Pseudoruegeria sp. HB172150]|uniref:class I SAM-dependent DNA methyltransferase n=1 Tax=Pseudoruegeria sp. HB172150 TaxID=2721164 RepID=UPI0015578FF7|nr:class I SAM-dependent methyltransferase [Pseudoruegeria sp. HB172150]